MLAAHTRDDYDLSEVSKQQYTNQAVARQSSLTVEWLVPPSLKEHKEKMEDF